MSNIKLWLLSVCVFSVIMSLFRILLPRGNVKKTAGTALSFIFLMFIISSASKNWEEAFSQPDFSVFGDETEETAADNMSAYEIAVEKSLAEALSSREIEYEKITFDMNKTADDIIEISNVCLSVPYNSPSDDEIISAVTDYTGFSREIIRIIRDEQ